MKILKRVSVSVVSIIALFAALNFPLNTRQGIGGVVATKKIPLYAKACGYLFRDYQYRELSGKITEGAKSDIEKVMAIYMWTVENIKRPPKDFPVIDDHIWDIIVRRYGGNDQIADVFTTLVSYAGYEAFWEKLNTGGSGKALILSFVRIGKEWRVFDLYYNKYFLNDEDLSQPTPWGPAYKGYLDSIDKTKLLSRIRRPDKQKLIPRLIYEFEELPAKLIGKKK